MEASVFLFDKLSPTLSVKSALNEGLAVFLHPWQQLHTATDLRIVITHYPQQPSLGFNLVYFSAAP